MAGPARRAGRRPPVGLARSVDCGRPGGRAAATAACSCSRCWIPTEARAARKAFIGYSDLDVAAHVPHVQCGLVASTARRWPDGLAAASGRLRPRLVPAGRADTRRAARRADGRPAVEALRPGEAGGLLLGGNADAAGRVARHAVRVRSRPPASCSSSTRWGSGRTGSIACGRSSCLQRRAVAGVGHRLRRAAAMRRARRASRRRAPSWPISCADFPGPVLFGFPSGHTRGPGADAAARRQESACVAGRTARPASRSTVEEGGRRVGSAMRGGVATVKRVHLIGVCGTAMATLAAMLKRRGWDVSGSDANMYPPMSTFLAEEGITTLSGYQRRRTSRPTSISSSSATRCRGATPRSRRCSIGRSATPRCRRRSASTSCGRRGRSSSPARTARRRRRR